VGKAVRGAAGSDQLGRDIAGIAGELAKLRDEVETLRGAVRDLRGLSTDLVRADRRSILHRSVWSTMEWIRVVDVPEDLLVSVITPTRNRSTLLRRAMASVVEQQYPRWEHVVVNDGSEDDTDAVLNAVADERVRPIRGEGGGASAARNLGLEAARGDLVAYLDDDNVMHPGWLRAAVWALGEREPQASVAYGARVVEEVGVIGPGGERELSAPLQLEAFDRERLRLGNYIDLGTIVHRRGHPEARFDEELAVLHDWDLVIRLTAEEEPVLLPAVALLYRTGAPGRLTGSDRRFRDLDLMRARGTVSPDAAVG
jgi:glycosyltransferase involved in cell wall biosynthesis